MILLKVLVTCLSVVMVFLPGPGWQVLVVFGAEGARRVAAEPDV